MPKKTQDLQQFLVEELQDLYDAEKQIVKSLPRMAKAATNEDLKSNNASSTWNRRPRPDPAME